MASHASTDELNSDKRLVTRTSSENQREFTIRVLPAASSAADGALHPPKQSHASPSSSKQPGLSPSNGVQQQQQQPPPLQQQHSQQLRPPPQQQQQHQQQQQQQQQSQQAHAQSQQQGSANVHGRGPSGDDDDTPRGPPAKLAPKPPPLTPDEESVMDELIADLIQNCSAARVADVECAKLRVESILLVCRLAEQQLLSEPALLHLDAPINIVGDIHGQFLDLLRFFEAGGFPPNAQYLFLGDYVDRGRMGMECTVLLFCYKVRYPGLVYLLRGNHECSMISRMYGFHFECKSKYNVACWEAVNDVFRALPLAAIVNDRLFATHGGLSPSLNSLEDIDRIQRPTDVPVNGLVCDLLWADPSPKLKTWQSSDRGVSYLFGEETLELFMQTYDFDLFVRAHQVVEEGYEFFPPGSRRLVTVFSAANYCASFDNAGAMLIVDKDLVCSFHVIKPPLGSTQLCDGTKPDRPSTPRPD